MSKIGLGITSYFCGKTPPGRLDIFRRSIESLLSSDFQGPTYLVDDGSTIQDHLKLLESLDKAGRVKVHKRVNGGIARAKNSCIKLILDSGCNIGFLADDDLLYKDKRWFEAYEHAINVTGIHHFSFFYEKTACREEKINNLLIRCTPHVNGCFLTFTKELIDKIGYFKILSYRYGHEHSNFSVRTTKLTQHKHFYDIKDSGKYIDLIPESLSNRSIGEIDQAAFKKNETEALCSQFRKEPLII